MKKKTDKSRPKKVSNHCQPQLAHNSHQCNLKIFFSQLGSASSRKFHYIKEPSRKFHSHWSHELLPLLVMLEKCSDYDAIINIARKNFRQWWRQTWKGFYDFHICWSAGEGQTIENVANHKNKINISLRQITISSWFITFEPFFNNGKSFIPLAPLLSLPFHPPAHTKAKKSLRVTPKWKLIFSLVFASFLIKSWM